MISVIIATNESERTLAPTLAALVPGALDGIVSEVIVADAGSRDGTAVVADVAGCRYIASPEPLGARLKTAAAAARAPWLLFMQAGSIPDVTWVQEANRFVLESRRSNGHKQEAAVFRLAPAGSRARSALVEAFFLITAALGAPPRPEQGLLISKMHYESLGSHRAESSEPETDLLRRLGRRRIVLLRSSVTATDQ